MTTSRPICLVRGSGDIGSAVAHVLRRRGFVVALHDIAAPGYPRRGMAFTDAFFEGFATVEGATARLVADGETLRALALRAKAIPAIAGSLEDAIRALGADVLVDARMRKREAPEPQVGMAPLTLGLGPGFVAGENVDLAIETMWGEMLGTVIDHGPTLALRGEPRPILGRSRERFIYAPFAGVLESEHRIGDPVSRGDEVARIEGTSLRAAFDGVLAGLTRPGVAVRHGSKIIEIDPRGERSLAFGLTKRGVAIAAGVVHAVERAFELEVSRSLGAPALTDTSLVRMPIPRMSGAAD